MYKVFSQIDFAYSPSQKKMPHLQMFGFPEIQSASNKPKSSMHEFAAQKQVQRYSGARSQLIQSNANLSGNPEQLNMQLKQQVYLLQHQLQQRQQVLSNLSAINNSDQKLQLLSTSQIQHKMIDQKVVNTGLLYKQQNYVERLKLLEEELNNQKNSNETLQVLLANSLGQPIPKDPDYMTDPRMPRLFRNKRNTFMMKNQQEGEQQQVQAKIKQVRDQCEQKLKEKDNQVTQLQKRIQVLELMIQDQTTQIINYDKEQANYKQSKLDQDEKDNNFQLEINNLQFQCQQYSDQIVQLYQEIQQLKQQKSIMQQQIDQQIANTDKSKIKIYDLSQELGSMIEQKQEIESQCVFLQNQLESLGYKITPEMLQNKNESFKPLIKTLKQIQRDATLVKSQNVKYDQEDQDDYYQDQMYQIQLQTGKFIETQEQQSQQPNNIQNIEQKKIEQQSNKQDNKVNTIIPPCDAQPTSNQSDLNALVVLQQQQINQLTQLVNQQQNQLQQLQNHQIIQFATLTTNINDNNQLQTTQNMNFSQNVSCYDKLGKEFKSIQQDLLNIDSQVENMKINVPVDDLTKKVLHQNSLKEILEQLKSQTQQKQEESIAKSTVNQQALPNNCGHETTMNSDFDLSDSTKLLLREQQQQQLVNSQIQCNEAEILTQNTKEYQEQQKYIRQQKMLEDVNQTIQNVFQLTETLGCGLVTLKPEQKCTQEVDTLQKITIQRINQQELQQKYTIASNNDINNLKHATIEIKKQNQKCNVKNDAMAVVVNDTVHKAVETKEEVIDIGDLNEVDQFDQSSQNQKQMDEEESLKSIIETQVQQETSQTVEKPADDAKEQLQDPEPIEENQKSQSIQKDNAYEQIAQQTVQAQEKESGQQNLQSVIHEDAQNSIKLETEEPIAKQEDQQQKQNDINTLNNEQTTQQNDEQEQSVIEASEQYKNEKAVEGEQTVEEENVESIAAEKESELLVSEIQHSELQVQSHLQESVVNKKDSQQIVIAAKYDENHDAAKQQQVRNDVQNDIQKDIVEIPLESNDQWISDKKSHNSNQDQSIEQPEKQDDQLITTETVEQIVEAELQPESVVVILQNQDVVQLKDQLNNNDESQQLKNKSDEVQYSQNDQTEQQQQQITETQQQTQQQEYLVEQYQKQQLDQQQVDSLQVEEQKIVQSEQEKKQIEELSQIDNKSQQLNTKSVNDRGEQLTPEGVLTIDEEEELRLIIEKLENGIEIDEELTLNQINKLYELGYEIGQ